MRINIHEVPDSGLEYSWGKEEEWITPLIRELGTEFGDKFRIDLQVLRADENLVFRGRLIANLIVQCSRCGESFFLPVDREFTSTYCSGKEGTGVLRDEVRLSKGDLDLTFFAGEEVDLSMVLNEQFVLAIPYRPLCHDECKGLCPYCGKNLNEGDCRCEKGSWSLKFSALLDLKSEQSID